MKFLKLINWPIFIVCLFSLLGLIVSFILTVEKIELIKDSTKQFECNINAVIQCGSVMKSKEAELFGFPSSLLGIIGYTFVFAVSIYSLFIKSLDKYFALILWLVGLIGFIFSYFLLFTSAFKIHALCPYCLISCFSATNIFFALSFYTLKKNSYSFRDSINTHTQNFLEKRMFWPVIVLWYAGVTGIIILEFVNS